MQQGRIFLSFKLSRPTSGPTQPPQWLLCRAKQPGHETDHYHPPSAEAKNEWSYTSTPPMRLYAVDRDNFIFIHKT